MKTSKNRNWTTRLKKIFIYTNNNLKMNKLKVLFFIVSLSFSVSLFSQTDEAVLKTLYSQALTNGKSYEWLDYLSNQIGGRLSGSHNAERAVQWGKEELEKLGLDKVWLQPVMVPKWTRGAKEYAYLEADGESTVMNICALGGSVATNPLGIKASVIEVQDFEDLERLGKAKIEGKIVFYNSPMQ